MKVVLASASLRRQELLHRIVDEFDVIVSTFNEDSVKFNGDFSDYVKKIAKGKALNVANLLNDKDQLVIGCDTIVGFKECVLGKPKDKLEAFNILKKLSGNTHKVYSGIAIVNNKTNSINVESVCTEVKFSSLTNEEIQKYIDTGEPMDKAGSYGIQGFGGVFVEKIKGDYYNVVGLPLNKLNKMLREMGVNL